MEERRQGSVVILVPDTECTAADLEEVMRRLTAEGNRHLVINLERLPRPWKEFPRALRAMIELYVRPGRRLALCGAKPPDPPGILRDFQLHFDSERAAISWLKSSG
jgi:hypothetical protein